jgi:hypothetical protein
MTWLIVGAVSLLAFCWLMWTARKGGKDKVLADIGEANAKAAERIAQAVAESPDTKRAVLERLRSRHRKL